MVRVYAREPPGPGGPLFVRHPKTDIGERKCSAPGTTRMSPERDGVIMRSADGVHSGTSLESRNRTAMVVHSNTHLVATSDEYQLCLEKGNVREEDLPVDLLPRTRREPLKAFAHE